MKNKISFIRNSLSHKCPACGIGYMYEKLIDIKRKCDNCGFNLRDHDNSDAPILISMIISGIIIAALAFLTEIYFMIPLWLHLIIWLPSAIGLSIFLLKIMKSWRINLIYMRQEGIHKKNEN